MFHSVAAVISPSLPPYVAGGAERLLSADNIAIVALTLCLVASIYFNYQQYRVRNSDMQDYLKALLHLKDALTAMTSAVNILNERIRSHD